MTLAELADKRIYVKVYFAYEACRRNRTFTKGSLAMPSPAFAEDVANSAPERRFWLMALALAIRESADEIHVGINGVKITFTIQIRGVPMDLKPPDFKTFPSLMYGLKCLLKSCQSTSRMCALVSVVRSLLCQQNDIGEYGEYKLWIDQYPLRLSVTMRGRKGRVEKATLKILSCAMPASRARELTTLAVNGGAPMSKIAHVSQRTSDDCCFAAVSMLTGCTYEQVKECQANQKLREGEWPEQLRAVVERLSHSNWRIVPVRSGPLWKFTFPDNALLAGIWNPNDPNELHCVVIQGEIVHDPAISWPAYLKYYWHRRLHLYWVLAPGEEQPKAIVSWLKSQIWKRYKWLSRIIE